VYEDVTIELLNYDEEMIRSGLPIQDFTGEVIANDPVTHDMRHLVVRITQDVPVKFFPGQYVDIEVPGSGQTRSFSMANPSARESGQLEFIIKIYPDGLFSNYLATEVQVGDQLAMSGPYGVFTLRDAPEAPLVFVGGGAGMAPILCLLRSMAERGISRPATYYYGARRQADLCFENELRELERVLPGFRYVPALSDESWDGENGLITDVMARLAGNLRGAHGYVCGPPPMVEAAVPLLTRLGVPEKHVYFDKFTTTGETP
jgi:propane monooxygenase reductase subunit